MQDKLAVMKKRNIIGMVSGEPDMLAVWKAAAPDRIIVGSDLPGIIEPSIEAVEQALFLTPAQKRDIFYNNAARFLRFSREQIERHHSM